MLRPSPPQESTMKIVLVPIDGPASACRALSLALKELGDAAGSQFTLDVRRSRVPVAVAR